MPFDLGRVVVTGWLIALAVIDVRRRQLPHALTTLPLLVGGSLVALRALASIFGFAVPGQGWDNAAIALALAAILLSDTWLAIWPACAALSAVVLFGSDGGRVVVIAWLLALGLSKAGILGEGDAKVIMLLLILYPDVRLGAVLLITLGVLGAVLMVVHLRAAMPLWLLSIAHDLVTFKVPARTGEAGGLNVPLAPLLAGGALIYLWGVL